ncbi:MAG: Mur ligase family protein [Chloroflexi bacterium]|nr:Mur ligase family protein [Chloroflexota bacterium]
MLQTVAIATGKTVKELMHRTGRGGTALPGLIATTIDPFILRDLTARLPGGSAMVIGTNGKTTSTRLFATILETAGIKVANNRSGSNLLRGLTSTLLNQATLNGKLAADMGLFEVDEAAFPKAQAKILPKLILINNLFRDQLDRYGEIDTVRKQWAKTIQTLAPGTTLVLNADDPSMVYLARFAPEGVRTVFFGLDHPPLALTELPHAVDAARCIVCGATLVYDAIYISHMGHYHCPNCDFRRPDPDFVVKAIELSVEDGSQFVLNTPDGPLELKVGVPGLYNVYNAAGASAATLSLGIAPDHVKEGLAKFKSVFGRIERVALGDGRHLLMALVKNPVGFNEVLRMLTNDPDRRLKMMVVINDLYADGRDVSWLWDVDFEILAGKLDFVQTGGLRATDMANRLKYAGIEPSIISWEENIAESLKKALEHLEPGETLYITPTYTAMLQLREVLTKMGLVIPFWEE